MRHKIVAWIITVLLLTGASYAAAQGEAGPASHNGVVIEVVDGGGYTYMNIDENGKKFWIAAPKTVVRKGTKVSFTEQIWMTDFTGKSIDRTFDRILFVSGVRTGSPSSALEGLKILKAAEKAKPAKPTAAGAASRPDGTYTIEEIFSRKDELGGSTVKVHGNVVKVSHNIMGRTWVHIQDGTGSEGSDKIIFTSKSDSADVGAVVTAEGTLEVDKDFGYGYFYPVIVQESTFAKEDLQ